jgi:chromosomal replication initiator protein
VYYDSKRFIIHIPHPSFQGIILNEFSEVINEYLSSILERDLELDFSWDEPDSSSKKNSDEEEVDFPLTINPNYIFDNFVVGDSNSFCHAACKAVADNPPFAYNPLYIYGGVGLGKTHLLHAIGHHILDTRPHLTIFYITSDRFLKEIVKSIRESATFELHRKYSKIDVLLVDDVQFFANKERTQYEFFHIFNSLYDTNKQIGLTSDCPPRDSPALEERLKSRFEWGLITDIQPPDLETRMAIIEKKAEIEGIKIPDDVSFIIADRITSNIRIIEGAFNRLAAYSKLSAKPITLELAEEVLNDVLKTRLSTPTIKDIISAVSKHYKVSSNDLRSKKRNAPISFARHIAIYLSRELTNATLSDIGSAFGNRDHSTIIHSVNKIEESLDEDLSMRMDIDYLKKILTSSAKK